MKFDQIFVRRFAERKRRVAMTQQFLDVVTRWSLNRHVFVVVVVVVVVDGDATLGNATIVVVVVVIVIVVVIVVIVVVIVVVARKLARYIEIELQFIDKCNVTTF